MEGVFDVFAAMSGLKNSMEKSTIYLAGVRTQLIEDRFSFVWGELPVR